jgi:hypothetical protein
MLWGTLAVGLLCAAFLVAFTVNPYPAQISDIQPVDYSDNSNSSLSPLPQEYWNPMISNPGTLASSPFTSQGEGVWLQKQGDHP